MSTENDAIDPNQYDHIVEGGLELKSGTLQVLDCPTSEIEFETKLKPGSNRVRVYPSNIASTDIDEMKQVIFIKLKLGQIKIWYARF